MMKTLVVSRKMIVSIFTVILLVYSLQGMSYGQEALTITPGETNTSLAVNFQIRLEDGVDQNVYQVQLRRKMPIGEEVTKCIVVKHGTGVVDGGDPDVYSSRVPVGFTCVGIIFCTGGGFSNKTFDIKAIFTDLDPGTTYEARWRDTNSPTCNQNPPNPDPWVYIGEGTTHLVAPPRVEFVDVNLAKKVRLSLGLGRVGGHIELLKIPQASIEKLTKLEADEREIMDLTGLEHATQLTKLSLPSNDIIDISPLANLTQLTKLSLPSNNIIDISPLANLTQLTMLNLNGEYSRGNFISDLTPLAKLTQLVELKIVSNEISDLTPLAKLIQLETLDLSFNDIVDITPLANLTQLKTLDISFNDIVDITPLANLTQLKTLDIKNNEITDLVPLAHLTQLTSIIADDFRGPASDIRVIMVSGPETVEATVNGGSVTLRLLSDTTAFDSSINNIKAAVTISGIEGVTVSDIIRVSDTEIEVVLAFTGELVEPTTLTFTVGAEVISGYRGNEITVNTVVYFELVEFADVSLARAVRKALGLPIGVDTLKIPKSELEKLTEFSIGRAKITDLTGLEYATQLKKLDLWENRIDDLTPLAQLTQLEDLDLAINHISDITPLTQLTKLTVLELRNNGISNITPLANLTKLEVLELDNNDIGDITPLANLIKLEVLELDNNDIGDITPLANLIKLKRLSLRGNNIVDVTSLAQLTQLERLFLSRNQIRDVTPLASLTSLEYLWLEENPIWSTYPLNALIAANPDLNIDVNITEAIPFPMQRQRPTEAQNYKCYSQNYSNNRCFG